MRGQAAQLLGSDHPATSSHCCAGSRWAYGQWPCGVYSRSIPVHLDGIDTVFGPAPTLKEGTVVLELQALAGEVAALKDFQAKMLPVLRAPRGWRKERRPTALSVPPHEQKPVGAGTQRHPG